MQVLGTKARGRVPRLVSGLLTLWSILCRWTQQHLKKRLIHILEWNSLSLNIIFSPSGAKLAKQKGRQKIEK